MNGGGGSAIRRIGLGWKAFNNMSSMLCGKKHHEISKNKFIGYV